MHVQDARTFVNACSRRFDAVVFDMFQGDGKPDYLLIREFFRQPNRCMTPKGVMEMNMVDDPQSPQVRHAILSTVNSAFGNVNYFQDVSSKILYAMPFWLHPVASLALSPLKRPRPDS